MDQDNFLVEERAPLTKAEVYHALQKSKGNIAQAARDLGAPRRKVNELANSSPAIVALLNDLREGHIDLSEQNVFNDVEKGDQAASKFVLQTLGKSRGWAMGVEGTGKGGAIQVEITRFAPEVPDAGGQ